MDLSFDNPQKDPHEDRQQHLPESDLPPENSSVVDELLPEISLPRDFNLQDHGSSIEISIRQRDMDQKRKEKGPSLWSKIGNTARGILQSSALVKLNLFCSTLYFTSAGLKFAASDYGGGFMNLFTGALWLGVAALNHFNSKPAKD